MPLSQGDGVFSASLEHRHMMADLDPIFASRPGWQRIYIELPYYGRRLCLVSPTTGTFRDLVSEWLDRVEEYSGL